MTSQTVVACLQPCCLVITPSYFHLLMGNSATNHIMWTWCVTFGKNVVKPWTYLWFADMIFWRLSCKYSNTKLLKANKNMSEYVPVVVATMLMSVWTDSISCACCLCRAVLLLLATLSCLSKASMAAIWVLTTDWETNIHSCWTTFSWPQTSYITFMTVSVYISQLRLK